MAARRRKLSSDKLYTTYYSSVTVTPSQTHAKVYVRSRIRARSDDVTDLPVFFNVVVFASLYRITHYPYPIRFAAWPVALRSRGRAL